MGVLDRNITHSGTRVIAPRLDNWGDILNPVQNVLGGMQKRDDLLKQQAIENADKAQRMQLLKDAGQRQASKAEQELLSRNALQDVAKNYSAYGEADNTLLDREVLGMQDRLIPDQTPVAQGVTPEVDQNLFDRQAKLQALYEAQTPTKDRAMSGIVNKAIAQGADPTKAAALATSLTGDLTSQADTLKLYEATAKAQNKRADTLFKEQGKNYRSGTSGKGKTSYTSLQESLNKNEYGSWDTGNIKKVVKTAEANGVPAHIMKGIIATESGPGGLLTIGDKNVRIANLEGAVQGYLKNPKEYTAKYAGGKPELPAAVTAGDIAQDVLNRRQANIDEVLSGIRGGAKVAAPVQNQTPVQTMAEAKVTPILDPAPAATPKSEQVFGKGMEDYKTAIANIESGRDGYKAVNQSPNLSDGERALGKYQFLPSTLKGMGYTGTREEFLNSPQLQEQYMDKLTSENEKYLRNKVPGFDRLPESKRQQWLAKAHHEGGPKAVTGGNIHADPRYMEKFDNSMTKGESFLGPVQGPKRSGKPIEETGDADKFVNAEYTEKNFPGTQGEYEEYAAAKESKDPGTLSTLWRDLTEPGFFANRIKKIEQDKGGEAAVVEMLFNSGPSAVTDVVGAGGLVKWLVKKGTSKVLAKQVAKEADDISKELTKAMGNRQKEAAAKARLETLRKKYNLQGVGTRGRKVPTKWETGPERNLFQ